MDLAPVLGFRASLVSALCRLEEYEGCSVGVICMVSTDQALYIDSVLSRRLSVTEYQRRQILWQRVAVSGGRTRRDLPVDDELPLGEGPARHPSASYRQLVATVISVFRRG